MTAWDGTERRRPGHTEELRARVDALRDRWEKEQARGNEIPRPNHQRTVPAGEEQSETAGLKLRIAVFKRNRESL
jgi:hypothetical protein